jgi:translation initiation factor 4B
VTSREREVTNRLEKERDLLKDRTHPISRTNSRTASERGLISRTRTPPLQSSTPSTPTSPKNPTASLLSSVHPSVSFAHVAGAKKDGSGPKDEMQVKDPMIPVMENIAEVAI